jgi:hypothetical protein
VTGGGLLRRDGARVAIGRGGWVGELRGLTVELSRGSLRANESCSGGSAAASSSPGLRMNGGAGLGKLGRERARERGERVVELPGVLMRAIDEGPGCCAARATAAARWQPREASAGRGEGRGGPARRKRASRSWGATRGRQREAKAKLELAGGDPARRRAAWRCRR